VNLLFRIAAAFHNFFCCVGDPFNFVPQLIDPEPFQFAYAVHPCTAADLLGHRRIMESVYDIRRGFSRRNTAKPNRVNLIRKDGELDNLASRALKEKVFRYGIRCGPGMPRWPKNCKLV
jgi:hypothetical protein